MTISCKLEKNVYFVATSSRKCLSDPADRCCCSCPPALTDVLPVGSVSF